MVDISVRTFLICVYVKRDAIKVTFKISLSILTGYTTYTKCH